MELVRGALKLRRRICARRSAPRIGYGVWEGSTLAEMQAADPVLYAKRLTAKWTMAPKAARHMRRAAPDARLVDSVKATPSPWPMAAPRGTDGGARIETPTSAADLLIEQGAVYVFRDGGLRKYS